jgi:hypothetical protein
MKDPFEKYCKNELTKDNYQLLFFDTSVLLELDIETTEILQKHKIRPVVNDFVFSEIIKGLDKGHKNFEKFKIKKLDIAKYLDSLGCLFMLSHKEIETMELKSACDQLNERHAHDFLQVFRKTPFHGKYEGLNDILHKELNYQLHLKRVIKEQENKQYITKAINNGLNENTEAVNQLKEYYKALCKVCKKKTFKLQNEIFIKKRLKEESIDSTKISSLIKIFDKDIFKFHHFAPHYSVSNYVSWKRWISENKVKCANDIMDEMHFISALSYCDAYVSLDKKHLTSVKVFTEMADYPKIEIGKSVAEIIQKLDSPQKNIQNHQLK